MIFLGELVCEGCRKIISYPLGAISCRCRNCNTVNAAQNMHLECGCCGQSILVPINTLTFLCPCCATVTDIPQSLLPLLEEPVDSGMHGDQARKTIYVTYPQPGSHKGDVKEGEQRHKSREEEGSTAEEEESSVNEEEEGHQRRRLRQRKSPPVVVVGTRIL
ncbi:hypothetical protein TraAM80_03577 [Trypanosoma rangeli]|uniref:Zinc finger LSD1-type domain-containing protein n=1 Tax=Trypanosoma rangeli TaxID=5698 RepID=A0A3R7L3Y9_TRYRA|nr:uncharacterized protein TraAM80_03577 [Trypanosoma rangeli]RNF07090.1 hypothetical protein TraAM80_03577 [Trypanosoma rangeli]|eukprot:RNF07090.1 hypothetical protein TraAM80_03577 [Trypanosoma rangeli]